MVHMTYLKVSLPSYDIWFSGAIANRHARCHVYPKWMKDPSSDFKDTFDRLFQGAMAALNGSDGIPWGCLALIWHLIISWQLPTQAQVVYPSKMTDPSNVFKDAVDGCSRVPWQLWMVEMTCLDVVLSLIWHPILSWQLPTRAQFVYPR